MAAAASASSLAWGSRVLFTHYFGEKFSYYLIHFAKYTVITCAVGFATYFVCGKIVFDSLWLTLGVKTVLCIVIPGLLYTAVYFKDRLFQESLKTLKGLH